MLRRRAAKPNKLNDTGWAPHLVRDPRPCPPELEPPASSRAWLAEAMRYARNPFEEDVLKGVIPLSLKGWMHGNYKKELTDPAGARTDRQRQNMRYYRERIKELLDFLYDKARIPLSIAVRNRREFVLVLGWYPWELPPDVSPGLASARLPTLSWCPKNLRTDMEILVLIPGIPTNMNWNGVESCRSIKARLWGKRGRPRR